MAEANILDIKVTCPECKKQFAFKELENHMKFQCEFRQIKCAKINCDFMGKEDELSEHYAHEHRQELLENAPQFLNSRLKCPICGDGVVSKEFLSHFCTMHEQDIIKEFGGRLQAAAPSFREGAANANGSEALRQIMNTHYEDMIKVLDNAHRTNSRKNSKIQSQTSVEAAKQRLPSQSSVDEMS